MTGVREGAGFTLVELMVTLAIVGLLAALALPFSLRWMDSDRQLQARGMLTEGVGQARALALRNPHGQGRGAPVACLRLDPDAPQLEVARLPAGAGCDAGRVVWSGSLHASLRLRDAGTGAPFRCVAFDSRGAHADPAQAPDCTQANRLQVVGRDESEALDVDLL